MVAYFFFFFFQAEDCIRDGHLTGVQTCALPIFDQLAAVIVVHDSVGEDEHLEAADRRSEERRVGKECRARWSAYHLKKKKKVQIKNITMTIQILKNMKKCKVSEVR